ncbi:HupE/UreJ family protein [Novosphingobium flavum]|uniref:HupE/UreJ family protein n=1 Tax=Novosphingobium flavum TaxID=1778672 RepID=A0A7X1FQN2_9SPHN|nr:HupE/UreJ family protein [Novosphingobium flavum]MBC2665176.1 HupE/UreJ family protein [Novosphingobium flavum]
MTRAIPKTAIALAAFLALPGTAMAHPGHGSGGGLAEGLLHPLTGADHIAALLIAGLWAGALGARFARVLPLVLTGAMLAGFAMADMVTAPLAEGLIAVTLAALAAAFALRLRPPLTLAAGLAGLAGLAHGFAHGIEAPDGAAGTGFVIGFLVSAAALQGLGLLLFAAGKAVLRRRSVAARGA